MIAAKAAILSHIMNRRTWHRTQTLLLAVLLGLGMSLWFVQGSVMAAEMAVAADDARHGASGCDDCGGGNHEGMDAGTCLAVCGTAAQGLMPGELLTLPSTSRADFQIAQLRLSGQFHSPDHGPPKISPSADA
jgi:hypothetical protein